MSPDEEKLINQVGVGLYINVIMGISTCILQGIYCLTLGIGVHVYCTKGSSNLKILLGFLLAGTFIMATGSWLSQTMVQLGEVKEALVIPLPGGIMSQIAAANAAPLVSVCIWLQSCYLGGGLIIADIFVVWRAWAVWADKKIVKWILLITMVANTALMLADTVENVELGTSSTSNDSITLDWASLLLSFSLNILATCLIAYRGWTHRRAMQSISGQKNKTVAEEIILLLVESGAIYALLQLMGIIMSGLDVNVPKGALALGRSPVTLLLMYWTLLNPVAIFILVQTKNTCEESYYLDRIPVARRAGSQQEIRTESSITNI
ncbi:hypothetical protein BDP27DRAFT_1334855 [Rhodocollybia butyracea]|uniref:Uncharacterized protein n=1 Tax=Rhodocollybia butyracea TaxID=206335 RepID=A0A9P5PGT9_9AGAR|nr:hypothetical protein BDP27DRAFT_1340144 [Rhodocollybia butyracea]KAF9063623.1 hypothetical protein BDP27DRAFT_1334855 [Rhodocollybia butyracea]